MSHYDFIYKQKLGEERFDAHRVAYKLRRSAEIQDGQTRRETGWADTSDRAELMREAANIIDYLISGGHDDTPVAWLVDEGVMLSNPKEKFAVPLYARGNKS